MSAAPQIRRPIFIVGMPRSGTTLLARILSLHPSIAIALETHFLSIWQGLSEGLDFSRKQDWQLFWRSLTAGKWLEWLDLDPYAVRREIEAQPSITLQGIFSTFMRSYGIAHGKIRCGEKTPDHWRHIATLLHWYPDACILFMVRDPRAVVRSVFRAPWGHRSAYVIANEWQRSIDVLNEWTGDTRVMPVRYESLVAEPEPVIRRICTHIGEDFSSTMLSPQDHRYRPFSMFTHTPFVRENQAIQHQPITTAFRDRWRAALPMRTVKLIELRTKKGMEQYGYDFVASKGYTLGDRLYRPMSRIRGTFPLHRLRFALRHPRMLAHVLGRRLRRLVLVSPAVVE